MENHILVFYAKYLSLISLFWFIANTSLLELTTALNSTNCHVVVISQASFITQKQNQYICELHLVYSAEISLNEIIP